MTTSPMQALLLVQTFVNGKPIAKNTISQPIQQMTKDIAQLTKELKKAQAGSPYSFVEVIQGDKRIRMTRQEVHNLFVATHGPSSKFDTYTARPKGQPFPKRVDDGLQKINKLIQTREEAKAKFNAKHKVYFSSTRLGSVMDANIARTRGISLKK